MGIRTSGGKNIGILKKIKDADPADRHHAPEWKERQRSRIEGPRSRLLLWRSSPQRMRDDLENIYILLFRFVWKGFQPALSNVSWPATRESVVLVPDPVVVAPWPVLFDRGEPCDSCRDTSDEAAFLRIGKSDVYQQPIAGLRSFAVCYPSGQWTPPLVVVLCYLSPMPYHKSTRATLVMRWTA